MSLTAAQLAKLVQAETVCNESVSRLSGLTSKMNAYISIQGELTDDPTNRIVLYFKNQIQTVIDALTAVIT